MNLSFLLRDFVSQNLSIDPVIQRLMLDSRFVQAGDLFFALPGHHIDGRQFIASAIKKGAVAILTEGQEEINWQDDVPIISFPNLRMHVSEMAARFYDFPAKKLKLIGVTGTSGKTTCTQFIAMTLEKLGHPCAVIGTLGNGFLGKLQPADLTTPDPIALQKLLADFVLAGAEYVAMEVSSHALDQGRVKGIEFEVGLFTNLSRDHLDYHGTMEAYFLAKTQLFQQSKKIIVNSDDAFIKSFLLKNHQENIFTVSLRPQEKTFSEKNIFAKNIQTKNTLLSAEIETPWGKASLSLSLVGYFNLANALMTLTTLCALGFPFEKVVLQVNQLKSVSGRMEMFGGDHQPLVVVDYAHKPDALEKVLQTLQQQCHGQLWCVFGCGGERDRGKRPLMAAIAERFCDKIFVTNDNPRHEAPEQIVAEILTGFSDLSKVTVQMDRALAIREVMQLAKKSDVILIAGKGAETYQIMGEEKMPFSDLEEVRRNLLEKK